MTSSLHGERGSFCTDFGRSVGRRLLTVRDHVPTASRTALPVRCINRIDGSGRRWRNVGNRLVARMQSGGRGYCRDPPGHAAGPVARLRRPLPVRMLQDQCVCWNYCFFFWVYVSLICCIFFIGF